MRQPLLANQPARQPTAERKAARENGKNHRDVGGGKAKSRHGQAQPNHFANEAAKSGDEEEKIEP